MVNARIVFGTAWDYVILSFYSRFSTKLYEEPFIAISLILWCRYQISILVLKL
jgi:hypothetical protein